MAVCNEPLSRLKTHPPKAGVEPGTAKAADQHITYYTIGASDATKKNKTTYSA